MSEHDELLDLIDNFLAKQEGPIGGLVITFEDPKDHGIAPPVMLETFPHGSAGMIGLMGHPRHEILVAPRRLMPIPLPRMAWEDFRLPEPIGHNWETPDKTKDWEQSDFIPESGTGSVCLKELTKKERAERKRQRQARKKSRR